MVCGLVLAAFACVPTVLWLQRVFDVHVDPTPRPLDTRLGDTPAGYWVTWIVSTAALAAPGLVLALFQRTRRAALGYLTTACVVAIPLGAWWLFMDFGGAPVPD